SRKTLCLAFSTMLISVTLTFSLGCVNENQPYVQFTSVTIPGSRICVDHFADSIERYVYAKFSEQEVVEFWDCLNNAVQLLNKYVRGQEPHRFHKNELRDFIQQFFMPDRGITDQFLVEIMRVKTLLLGGDLIYMTKPELNEMRGLFEQAKQITLDLYPHMTVINLPLQAKDSKPSSQPSVDGAIEILTKSLVQIGQMFTKYPGSYQFSHLETLVDEVDDFLTYEDPIDRFNKLSLYIPILAHAKSLLLGAGHQAIQQNQWVDLFDLAGQAYGVTVRFSAHILDQDFTQGEPLHQVDKTVTDVSRILINGLKRHEDSKFSHAEIEGLLSTLPAADLLPEDFDVTTILSTWKVLVDKLLASGISNSDGFSLRHMENLLREYKQWFQPQVEINKIFTSIVTLPSCGSPLLRFSNSNYGFEEMKRITDCAPWAVRHDEDYRLYLDYNNFSHIPERFSVSTLNWQRALVHLLAKAYATDPSRQMNRTGLTEKELGRAYKDLKPLLVAFELVDKNDDDYYKDIVRDTRFFMPQSNGNDIVEFTEGVEYYYNVLSGTEITIKMVEDLKLACDFKDSMGERFGAPFIKGDCTRKFIGQNFAKYYHHLPEMAKFQQSLSAKEWDKMLSKAFVALGLNDNELEYLSQARLVELSIFLQYVETFVLRFDHNQNGKLAGSELAEALDKVGGSWGSLLSIGTAFFSFDRAELITLFADMKWLVE
ncbi:MAG: hypothetical protein KDD43_05590, partial [Bdellovibrionales bacterium]|nr:hypothetical protein [Bdellovibrionales bacterium]